jgi:hypothetical protein
MIMTAYMMNLTKPGMRDIIRHVFQSEKRFFDEE